MEGMEMFLMVAAISLFGTAVCALAFVAATGPAANPEIRPAENLATAPSRFFVTPGLLPQPGLEAIPAVSIDLLLLQIERHVRLEQAIAESFHEFPTLAALQAPTASPLVH
jgi:hypothetical protein